MTASEKQPACSTLMEAESLDGFLFYAVKMANCKEGVWLRKKAGLQDCVR